MADTITQKFEELVLEFEDPANPNTYVRICGLIDIEVTRTAEIDTIEVPKDCTDESLPLSREKSVRSIDVSVSGTGVWAQQSQGILDDWFYSSLGYKIRIQNVNAASGATEYESGSAFLTNFTVSRTKGQKVAASISIEFDGTPTRTAKP